MSDTTPQIQYAVPLPNRPHVVHVGLRVLEDGKPVTREIPVRRAHYEALGSDADRLAYALECAEYHAATGPGWQVRRDARRAAWSADDEAAEKARFVVKPLGWTKGKDGKVTGVRVEIRHQGVAIQAVVPPDPKAVEQNARKAFADHEAKGKDEQAALAAFSVAG